jgi:hypothetical protein
VSGVEETGVERNAAGPLVSVCIPCHNKAGVIRETLDSVLGQTYPRIEVVVVDDGSSDGSAEIVQQYEARGVRLVRTRLGNASKSRNAAMKESRGSLIKFLDGDDLLTPTMIESQVAAIGASDGVIAAARFERFDHVPGDAADRGQQKWRTSSGMEWVLETISTAGDGVFQCGMFLFPRGLIEKCGGWDEELSYIDDMEFHIRLLTACEQVRFVDEVLWWRRPTAGHYSSRRSAAAYASAAKAVERSCRWMAERANGDARVLKACATLCLQVYCDVPPSFREERRTLWRLSQQYGGSDHRPQGGSVFEAMSRVLGWRAAWTLRQMVGPRYAAVRRRLVAR